MTEFILGNLSGLLPAADADLAWRSAARPAKSGRASELCCEENQ